MHTTRMTTFQGRDGYVYYIKFIFHSLPFFFPRSSSSSSRDCAEESLKRGTGGFAAKAKKKKTVDRIFPPNQRGVLPVEFRNSAKEKHFNSASASCADWILCWETSIMLTSARDGMMLHGQSTTVAKSAHLPSPRPRSLFLAGREERSGTLMLPIQANDFDLRGTWHNDNLGRHDPQ